MPTRNDFSFLYPPPRLVRFGGGLLDIRSMCFPLEIFKKFDFLFEHFSIRNRSHGLQVIFQEQRDLAGEAYAMECGGGRIVLSAGSPRGQFYAVTTLLQVLAFHAGEGRIPEFALRDAPEIAFRGFMLPGGNEGVPAGPELRRWLLKLALLKFNHLALPAAALGRDHNGIEPSEGSGWNEFAGLARKTGMEVICLDSDTQALFRIGAEPIRDRLSPSPPVRRSPAGNGKDPAADDWFTFFIHQHRLGKSQGKRIVAWGDNFLPHPEWIRRIPQDTLVLNRESAGGGRAVSFAAAVAPFARHHIPQVLCPTLCGRGRFIPDARAAMASVHTACALAKNGKLAGVLLASAEDDWCGCLPEGASWLQLQAGCWLWSGKSPAPEAFSLWVLGREEPDLFRVYSFLAQAEHRLPHSHGRYLFEDPLLAPFSRQGDPREVEAHFRKAAQYLRKREIAPNELSDFLDFARRMYEFIAAKVAFSHRLGALLRNARGDEGIRLQAMQLDRESRELKSLYCELWSKHYRSGAYPHDVKGFAFLAERFASIQRAASSPASRRELLAELKNDSLAISPVILDGFETWGP